jgi:serine/threonine protein kinase
MALNALQHPNILGYIDHGRTPDGRSYLATEWLDGEDLAAVLARGRLSVTAALSLTASVARTLGFAHERGLVHRDLKPSNIFLLGGDLDRIKIIDFGVVRFIGITLKLTRHGTTVGTPGYMAPEQARGEDTVDARADVFSLGCVLFECLTGRPPFVADHPLAVLTKILFEQAPPPSQLRPDLAETPLRVYALAMLASTLLRAGLGGKALRVIQHMLASLQEQGASLEALGEGAEGESFIRLAHAEVLFEDGQTELACEVIKEARARLFARADRIRRAAWQESFLARVPHNARTIELARERLGDGTSCSTPLPPTPNPALCGP